MTRNLHPCGVLFVAALLTTTSGCSVVGVGPQATKDVSTSLTKAVDAKALADAHTEYVGNSSADAAILDALHLEVVGARTFELLHSGDHHELRINFNTVAQGLDAATAHQAMRKRATLAMACIDNVDAVSWRVARLNPPDGVITRAEAEKLAGRKLTGQCTPDALQRLAQHLDA